MRMIIYAMMAALILPGCSKAAPKCSDSNTVKAVAELVKQEARKSIPADDMTVSIEGIRTTGTDKETGAQFCEAEAVLDSPTVAAVKGTKFPVKFKSELTDKKEPYVSVKFR